MALKGFLWAAVSLAALGLFIVIVCGLLFLAHHVHKPAAQAFFLAVILFALRDHTNATPIEDSQHAGGKP